MAGSKIAGKAQKALKTASALAAFAIALFWLYAPLHAIDAENQPLQGIELSRWVAGEKIFHGDPRWVGGDGASSVDLGSGRVLWLFGDTLIDPSGSGSRRNAVLIRNSVAIQTGYDPSKASISFAWRAAGNGPSSFFPDKGARWFWPASGVMVGKHLIIFLFETEKARNALGFECVGWKAVWISNPLDPPGRWNITPLSTPQMDGLLVGSGTPVIENGFLHVFAADGNGRVYLARWPEEDAVRGILTSPQWWCGDKAGWLSGQRKKEDIAPVFTGGQAEFGLQYFKKQNLYVRIQTLSMANPCVAKATASLLTGPWSRPECFFAPPELDDPGLFIYAAKNHPHLLGADIVVTYVTNPKRFDRIFSDNNVYFPVMLKGCLAGGISRCSP